METVPAERQKPRPGRRRCRRFRVDQAPGDFVGAKRQVKNLVAGQSEGEPDVISRRRKMCRDQLAVRRGIGRAVGIERKGRGAGIEELGSYAAFWEGAGVRIASRPHAAFANGVSPASSRPAPVSSATSRRTSVIALPKAPVCPQLLLFAMTVAAARSSSTVFKLSRRIPGMAIPHRLNTSVACSNQRGYRYKYFPDHLMASASLIVSRYFRVVESFAWPRMALPTSSMGERVLGVHRWLNACADHRQ
jgi:hypothetical protein